MSGVDPLAIGRIMNSNLGDAQRQEIASEEFESYLIGMLIKEMRKTIPEGMFSSSAMDTFTEMMDQALAKQLAENGSFGFAEAMLRDVDGRETTSPIKDGIREFRTAVTPILKDVQHHISSHDHNAHVLQPVFGRLTSKFGMRIHPITNEWRLHDGIDIAAPKGTDIQSVMDGKVSFAGVKGGYGKTVVVTHDDGRESIYAHCDQVFVQEGDILKAGDKIAEVGSTGVSTGNHLHFEFRENGKSIDPLTQFPWLFEDK
jgi:murein DD-endopeptidase MepM/ murein hydrolase activator NlpD